MLTSEQEKYLSTLPNDKIVHIFPYTPKAKSIAEELIAKVHSRHPEINEGLFCGTAGLGISGQNDLDVDFLIKPEEFGKYLPAFIELFGEPRVHENPVAAWSFEIEGVEVDIWLTDETSQSVKDQHAIFHILQDTPPLRKEYEELKVRFDNKSYKDYQRAKYEFYNRILGVTRDI